MEERERGGGIKYLAQSQSGGESTLIKSYRGSEMRDILGEISRHDI